MNNKRSACYIIASCTYVPASVHRWLRQLLVDYFFFFPYYAILYIIAIIIIIIIIALIIIIIGITVAVVVVIQRMLAHTGSISLYCYTYVHEYGHIILRVHQRIYYQGGSCCRRRRRRFRLPST